MFLFVTIFWFLWNCLISIDCKGTGVISASGSGGSDSVCTDCAGNYTDEELKWALIVLSIILSIFLLILCCQCVSRVVNEYHRKRQLHLTFESKSQLIRDSIQTQANATDRQCMLHASNDRWCDSNDQSTFIQKTNNNNLTDLPLLESISIQGNLYSDQFSLTSPSLEMANKANHKKKNKFTRSLTDNHENRSISFQTRPKFTSTAAIKIDSNQSINKIKQFKKANSITSFKSLPPPPYIRNLNSSEHL